MNWKKWLPAIGIVLFIYMLVKLDIKNILSEISKVDLFFLILSVIFTGLLLIIQTFKWFVIARKQKIAIPFAEAFKINLISNFYGLITPSKIGGVIRANYLKKYTKNLGKGMSNFVLDKILDIASVFFIAILFSFTFKDRLNLPVNLFISIFLILVLVTLIFIKKERSKFFLRFFYKKFVPQKMKEKSKITFNSFYEDMPKKRFFILFFLLNIINWLVAYFITFLIAISLGINLPFVYFLAILPIGTVVSLIPISINGLGTREAILITLFSLFNIEAAKVFSMSLLALLITGILPSLITSILIFKKRGYIL